MITIRPIARKLTTALGAIAIACGAMAASAQPARANNDAAKVLAGIAAIAIIGTALNSQSHASPRPVHANPPRPVKPQPGWHQPVQPPRPHRPQAQAPMRPNQTCVRTGGNVVCGQAVQQRRAQGHHQPRPQPQRPGWHNPRYR